MAQTPRQAQEQTLVREKILASAREMFVKQGYEAVSLRKIAESIGYTAPALYTHFADKTAILQELCRRDFASLAEVFNKLAKVHDPITRIYRIGLMYIRFAVEHPNLVELAPPTPEDLAEFDDPDHDAYAFLHKAVREAMNDGRFRDEYKDAELLTQVLWSGVHGIASLEITHGDCPWLTLRSLDRRSKTMCASMLRGLLKNPESLEESA